MGVAVWQHVDMTTTQTLIASANTGNGFAIGIVQKTNGSKTVWDVVRLDRRSRYVTISRFATEAAARVAANIEYRKDRG